MFCSAAPHRLEARLLVLGAVAALLCHGVAGRQEAIDASDGVYVSWESHASLDGQRGALEVALAVAVCLGPGTRLVLHPWRPTRRDGTGDDANVGVAAHGGEASRPRWGGPAPPVDVALLADVLREAAGVEVVADAARVPVQSRVVVLPMDARCHYSCAWVRREVYWQASVVAAEAEAAMAMAQDADASSTPTAAAAAAAAAAAEESIARALPLFVPRLDHGIAEAVLDDDALSPLRDVVLAAVRSPAVVRNLARELAAAALPSPFGAAHMRLGDAEPHVLVNCPESASTALHEPAQRGHLMLHGPGCAVGSGTGAPKPLLVDDMLRALDFNLTLRHRAGGVGGATTAQRGAPLLYIATDRPASARIVALRREAARARVMLLTLADVLGRAPPALRERLDAVLAAGDAAQRAAAHSMLEQELCVLAAAYVACADSPWDQYVLRARAALVPTALPSPGAAARDAAPLTSLAALREHWALRETAARADYRLYVARARGAGDSQRGGGAGYSQRGAAECRDRGRPGRPLLFWAASLLLAILLLPACATAYALLRQASARARSPQTTVYALAARLAVAYALVALASLAVALDVRRRGLLGVFTRTRLLIICALSLCTVLDAAVVRGVALATALLYVFCATEIRGGLVVKGTGFFFGDGNAAALWHARPPAGALLALLALALVCAAAVASAGVLVRVYAALVRAAERARESKTTTTTTTLPAPHRAGGYVATLARSMHIVGGTLALALPVCYVLPGTAAEDVLDCARLAVELVALVGAAASPHGLKLDVNA